MMIRPLTDWLRAKTRAGLAAIDRALAGHAVQADEGWAPEALAQAERQDALDAIMVLLDYPSEQASDLLAEVLAEYARQHGWVVMRAMAKDAVYRAIRMPIPEIAPDMAIKGAPQ